MSLTKTLHEEVLDAVRSDVHGLMNHVDKIKEAKEAGFGHPSYDELLEQMSSKLGRLNALLDEANW